MTMFWPPRQAQARLQGQPFATEAPAAQWMALAARDGGPAFAPPMSCGTVYAALLNHQNALAALGDAMNAPPYKAPPVAPVLAIKPRNTLVGHRAAVAVPAEAGEIVVGATLAIVIGRTACRVTAAEALAHVAGYCVANDITLAHESLYRPGLRLRARDGFCPLGPVLVACDLVADVDALAVSVAIDGRMVQRWSTAGLVRGVDRLIADVTEFMTLRPGDVLLAGTPAPGPRARAGERVAITIAGLGTLETPLVAEEALR